MLNPFKFNREHPTTIHPRQKKSRVFIDCMSAAAQGKSEIVHLIFEVGLGTSSWLIDNLNVNLVLF